MSDDTTEFAKLGVQERIAKIRDGLLQQDPMLPLHLAHIHKTLIQYEELVHLLSDEEIKTLIAGQKKHTNTQLVKETVTAKRTRVPKTTVDML